MQIAFKPLTLKDLPESFIAVLRDGRNLDYNRSLMGVIRASLAKGPVYFDVYPNLQLSLTDKNILDALTVCESLTNIKRPFTSGIEAVKDGVADLMPQGHLIKVAHRMLMYATIGKNSGNSDKTIACMIIAGFTGQLKGWWENYLSQEDKLNILNMVKIDNNQQVENAVYTLVLNIIEHFSGKFTDNNETIRTLLQNLRCKTLTNFRWYKDVFLSRVMELPECNNTHWKSKFIDGLPYLFAENVRKILRGDTTLFFQRFLICILS